MPLYICKIGSKNQQMHSALPITHCLIGQRNAAFEKPADELIAKSQRMNAPKDARITSEELIEIQAYGKKVEAGNYSPQALVWGESEAECEAAKARFIGPEWDETSLRILPTLLFGNG